MLIGRTAYPNENPVTQSLILDDISIQFPIYALKLHLALVGLVFTGLITLLNELGSMLKSSVLPLPLCEVAKKY